MTFEQIRDNRGQPKLRCTCGACGAVEEVVADHANGGERQAITKLQKLGWTYVGKRLRCEPCSSVKHHAHLPHPTAPPVPEPPAREPTRAERREIMALLDVAYDVEAERYRGDDTDDSLAAELKVLPGWVAAIREEFFGPAGGNEEMDALADELRAFLKAANAERDRIEAMGDEVVAIGKALAGRVAEAQELLERLRKIKGAVGPRVMAKAGG